MPASAGIADPRVRFILPTPICLRLQASRTPGPL